MSEIQKRRNKNSLPNSRLQIDWENRCVQSRNKLHTVAVKTEQAIAWNEDNGDGDKNEFLSHFQFEKLTQGSKQFEYDSCGK